MTQKEFEVQEALGLAGEYILEITADWGHRVPIKMLKDVIEKHTFDAKCLEEETHYYDEVRQYSMGTHCIHKLRYHIKAVKEVMERITAEIYPYHIKISITFMWAHKQIMEFGGYNKIVGS